MSTEVERIARLEARIETLQKALNDEREEVKSLKTELDKTNKKIHTAESWGRAIIWVTLGISGFIAQFGHFFEWLKKL